MFLFHPKSRRRVASAEGAEWRSGVWGGVTLPSRLGEWERRELSQRDLGGAPIENAF